MEKQEADNDDNKILVKGVKIKRVPYIQMGEIRVMKGEGGKGPCQVQDGTSHKTVIRRRRPGILEEFVK